MRCPLAPCDIERSFVVTTWKKGLGDPSQWSWMVTVYYTKLHGQPPAESDIQRYFKVSAPAVHQMVVTLEQRGLIERVPGQASTIRVSLPPEVLPDLS